MKVRVGARRAAHAVGVDRGCGHRPGTESRLPLRLRRPNPDDRLAADDTAPTSSPPDTAPSSTLPRHRRVMTDSIATPTTICSAVVGTSYDAASTTTTVRAPSTTVAGTSIANPPPLRHSADRVARPHRATRRTWHGHDRRPRHRPVWGRHPRRGRPYTQRRFAFDVFTAADGTFSVDVDPGDYSVLLAIRQRSHRRVLERWQPLHGRRGRDGHAQRPTGQLRLDQRNGRRRRRPHARRRLGVSLQGGRAATPGSAPGTTATSRSRSSHPATTRSSSTTAIRCTPTSGGRTPPASRTPTRSPSVTATLWRCRLLTSPPRLPERSAAPCATLRR